ncbi:MAG: 2-oxoacid:ferredoxin oxidoreductase subunit beta [Candidatus Lokiarchaeota archaeon]|nr:2-oxoacid:ferredoxin oxidoreductase subunit beta [Candidatus Lokiarchaeota archaeon]
MKDTEYLIDKYLQYLPTTFCSGCGNGIILNCFIRALDDLELKLENILCVSGIGCSSWIPSPYLKLNTLHTLHGRAIPFASGTKIFNNNLKVIVFTGDGDGAGIGGNHLIHAARRNIDLTVILVNNAIYGMTGGQFAPTTPFASITSTSKNGHLEHPFPDLCKLVEASGGSYIARWTVYHPRELIKTIKEAISHEGFSFIEVMSPCPTEFGRKNQLSLVDYLRKFTLKETEPGAIKVGVFKKEIKPEFSRLLRDRK